MMAGCDNPKEAEVAGTVTVDGAPAKDGSIAFIPVDGMSRTAGAPIADGAYQARVPIGNMQVQIRVPKVVGQRKLYATPDSPTQPILVEVLPPKFNNESELKLMVKPGMNRQDYQLETK